MAVVAASILRRDDEGDVAFSDQHMAAKKEYVARLVLPRAAKRRIDVKADRSSDPLSAQSTARVGCHTFYQFADDL
jgi:hypothetical protein